MSEPKQDPNKKKFFVIVPPGFEKLASRELEARGYTPPGPEAAIRGGIELELPLENGYQLNRESHIATRVLERLEKWRCRDFPKLFNKTQTVAWEKWITGPYEVEVSAHRSRLMNKKRIAETVEKGIAARLKKNPAKKLNAKNLARNGTPAEPLKIFVRFNNDEVEMSLDTSGEALFKRGYKTMAEAAAPIRENLAAAVFWALYERAGRPTDITVIDPTCGSATLLTEAASFFSEKPERDYAYDLWSANLAKPKISAAAKSANATLAFPLKPNLPPVNVTLIGCDRDAETLKMAKQNAGNLGVKIHLSQSDFLKLEYKQVGDLVDSFERNPTGHAKASAGASKPAPMRIGLANPPYGERIKWPIPPKQFYAGLIDFFKASNCKVYGFIVPRQKVRDLPQAPYKIDFENGGIPVSLVVYGSVGGPRRPLADIDVEPKKS